MELNLSRSVSITAFVDIYEWLQQILLRKIHMAGDYWYGEYQGWIDSGEVTETSEEIEPGAPARTKYEYNLCGMKVQKTQTEDKGPR